MIHHTDVVKKDRRWVLECSCGYVGRPRMTFRDAEDDEAEHVRQMGHVTEPKETRDDPH